MNIIHLTVIIKIQIFIINKIFLNISKYFNNNYIKFYNKSFIDIKIHNNSFVYIDPQYYPSKTSSFTSYNKNNFTINQQILLNNYCNLLDKNNIKFFTI